MSKAKGRNNSAHRRVRLLVLERDGWTCQRCGIALYPHTPTHSGNATVDHYPHPLIERPDLLNDMSNLRALCLRCNSALGARLGNRRRKGHRTTPGLVTSRSW